MMILILNNLAKYQNKMHKIQNNNLKQEKKYKLIKKKFQVYYKYKKFILYI